ncbi:hypothetical protein DERP_002933, partial [Dermatophagoides pteronyssinus]
MDGSIFSLKASIIYQTGAYNVPHYRQQQTTLTLLYHQSFECPNLSHFEKNTPEKNCLKSNTNVSISTYFQMIVLVIVISNI